MNVYRNRKYRDNKRANKPGSCSYNRVDIFVTGKFSFGNISSFSRSFTTYSQLVASTRLIIVLRKIRDSFIYACAVTGISLVVDDNISNKREPRSI